MSNDKLEQQIMDYINRARKVLPDSFETDDFLIQLKEKINRILEDKIQERPTEDPEKLLFEVFEELGTPKDVSIDTRDQDLTESPQESIMDSKQFLIARGVIASVTVLIAAYILSINVGWDFNLSVGILLIFVIAEWIGSAWKSRNIVSSKS